MQILIVMYADMDFFYKKIKQYSSNFLGKDTVFRYAFLEPVIYPCL